jgi:hypothetical protein
VASSHTICCFSKNTKRFDCTRIWIPQGSLAIFCIQITAQRVYDRDSGTSPCHLAIASVHLLAPRKCSKWTPMMKSKNHNPNFGKYTFLSLIRLQSQKERPATYTPSEGSGSTRHVVNVAAPVVSLDLDVPASCCWDRRCCSRKLLARLVLHSLNVIWILLMVIERCIYFLTCPLIGRLMSGSLSTFSLLSSSTIASTQLGVVNERCS